MVWLYDYFKLVLYEFLWLYKHVEMYAELALINLFVCEGEIELPEEVKEDKELNRNRKKLVAELEVCLI